MDDAPTPPTVRKRVVARRRARDVPGPRVGALPLELLRSPSPRPFAPPPLPRSSSTPGLDRLRHQLIDELAGAFLALPGRARGPVVLVCGDWEDSAQDWAALVLDVEGCRPGSGGLRPLGVSSSSNPSR